MILFILINRLLYNVLITVKRISKFITLTYKIKVLRKLGLRFCLLLSLL